MRTLFTRAGRWLAEAERSGHTRDLVLSAALLLVVAQLGLRAWALSGTWFHQDDFSLIIDAREARFDAEYLLTPWNNHLMPLGRALAWAVAELGQLDWGLALASTLAMQALASAAAVWMLVTMFGRRPGILVPLSLYLFTSITVPATVWWTACLSQLSMQVGLFLAVGAAVRYLRGRRLVWAGVAYVGVAVGLLGDVKALLILPVLGYLALAYFATGGPVRRVLALLRRYWPAVALGLPALAAYLVYYTDHVRQPYDPPTASAAGRAVEAMLATGFPAGAVGGPWAWSEEGYADPPAWTVNLAWVLIVLVVLYGALRRERTLRAWLLLSGYLGTLCALVVAARVEPFGAAIGREYRYLTDIACVLALSVGLAFLELAGAEGSSSPRRRPRLDLAVPRRAVALLAAAVAISGVASSLTYLSWWNDHDDGRTFLMTLRDDVEASGAVDVADRTLPEGVISGLLAPDNRLVTFSSLVTDSLAFPAWSEDLNVVTDAGRLEEARIEPSVTSRTGPRPGCGWLVQHAGRSIPLRSTVFKWSWWIRIGYLASADSTMTISAGDTFEEVEVQGGVHSLYVQVEGRFATVRLSGLGKDVAVCVDTIEVGQPATGGAGPS